VHTVPGLRTAIKYSYFAGAARLTQIFLPLVRRAHGRVVFLTSGLNRVPSPVRGIQCATQAAVDCFAACLRQEMRTRGVDVSVVAAGEFAPGNGWLNETELRDQVRKEANGGIALLCRS